MFQLKDKVDLPLSANTTKKMSKCYLLYCSRSAMATYNSSLHYYCLSVWTEN